MKTEFKLEWASRGTTVFKATIVGSLPGSKPYVSIDAFTGNPLFIADKDLERFAVNILKALRGGDAISKKGLG